MEITVETIKEISDQWCDAFTVYIESNRILTISTTCDSTASKWLRDLQKSYRTKRKTLVVGLCADRNPIYSYIKDPQYDLIQLSVGSHCLLYHLPSHMDEVSVKFLSDFFSDPNVVAVGIGIEAVAKKLEKEYNFKIAKTIDLNCLAEQRLGRDDLDLGRYDLDRLAKVVLGKRADVIRPSKTVEWYNRQDRYCFDWRMSREKIKYATVDPYLCFMIGSELLERSELSSSSKVKMEKKVKYKEKKNMIR